MFTIRTTMRGSIRPCPEALLLGCVLAAAAIAAGALYHWLVHEPPRLAGAALFADTAPAAVLIMVIAWAPLWETVAAQVIPVAILRRCTHRHVLWIGASALVFSLGHMLGGGGPAQAVLTFSFGAVFAGAYVRWLPQGAWRASGAVALAHAVNNGLLFIASTIISA